MRAFTLVETLLSMTLLGLVCILVLNIFPSALFSVRSGEERYLAGSLADTILEEESARSFGERPVGTTRELSPIKVDQVEYRRKLEVLSVNTADPQYCRAFRATVEWTARGVSHRIVREIWRYRLKNQVPGASR